MMLPERDIHFTSDIGKPKSDNFWIMTNPNNVQDFPLPVSPADVTAITYYEISFNPAIGSLWVGTKDGSIHILERPRSEHDQYSFRLQYATARLNYCVKTLIPLKKPQCVIAHWLGLNKQAGPVQILRPGSLRQQIALAADFCLCSHSKTDPKIALVTNLKKIMVHSFNGRVLGYGIRTISPSQISAIDMCDDYLVYYAGTGYYIFNFASGVTTQLSASPTSNPLVKCLNTNTIVCGEREFLTILGGNGEKIGMSRYESTSVINSIYASGNNCYIFYDQCFMRGPTNLLKSSEKQVFPISGVTVSTMIYDTLLVLSESSAKLIGSMPPSSILAKDIIGDHAENVYNLLKSLARDQCSDAISSIFDELWKQKKPKLAIDLLSKFLLIGGIANIVSLVPIIVLTNPIQKMNLQPLPSTDVSCIPEMLSFLEFTRDNYLKESAQIYKDEIFVINTSLAQCYALALPPQCRKYDNILTEGQLDMKTVQEFMRRGNEIKIKGFGPANAVFETHKGNIDLAISIWKKLDDASLSVQKDNPLFTREASYALQKLKDSRNLTNYLDWLYDRNPEVAFNAILSPYHDVSTVNNWLRARGLTDQKLRYYTYICSQPNISKGGQFANDTVISLISILDTIDNPDFKVEKLGFTKAFQEQKTGNDLVSSAKEEITDLTIQILQIHTESIKTEDVLSIITDKIDKKIRFCIYRVKGRYTDALHILTENNQWPYEELVDFCRKAPEPQKAFSALLKLKPEKFFDRDCNAIHENLPYIDINELITLIPPTLTFMTYRKILKNCASLLMRRNQALDLQIATTKSMNIDANYQLSTIQAQYCTTEKQLTCAFCHQQISGDQQFYMAPGGSDKEKYHIQCRRQLNM